MIYYEMVPNLNVFSTRVKQYSNKTQNLHFCSYKDLNIGPVKHSLTIQPTELNVQLTFILLYLININVCFLEV